MTVNNVFGKLEVIMKVKVVQNKVKVIVKVTMKVMVVQNKVKFLLVSIIMSTNLPA
jgi:hypothetical protein